MAIFSWTLPQNPLTLRSLGTTALEKPMWYNISEPPYAPIVRMLLLTKKLCNTSLSKTGIAGEILDFLTSRRDEIAAIWMGYRSDIS
jgi:hypothetical protein